MPPRQASIQLESLRLDQLVPQREILLQKRREAIGRAHRRVDAGGGVALFEFG